MNPFAPSFDPPRREDVPTETEQNDEHPAHVNLLYEATVARTRLTAEVDQQFRDVLRRRATAFAKDSTDIGFCPVLQHDVDTGDSPPIKQSPRRPPLSAGDAENEILEDMLKTLSPCSVFVFIFIRRRRHHPRSSLPSCVRVLVCAACFVSPSSPTDTVAWSSS